METQQRNKVSVSFAMSSTHPNLTIHVIRFYIHKHPKAHKNTKTHSQSLTASNNHLINPAWVQLAVPRTESSGRHSVAFMLIKTFRLSNPGRPSDLNTPAHFYELHSPIKTHLWPIHTYRRWIKSSRVFFHGFFERQSSTKFSEWFILLALKYVKSNSGIAICAPFSLFWWFFLCFYFSVGSAGVVDPESITILVVVTLTIYTPRTAHSWLFVFLKLYLQLLALSNNLWCYTLLFWGWI